MKLSELIAQHRGGLDDADLTDMLRHLIGECARHDKAGTMTITLAVKPSGDGLAIAFVTRAKPPVEAAPAKVYFVDLNGDLTRRHPSQPSLDGMGVD